MICSSPRYGDLVIHCGVVSEVVKSRYRKSVLDSDLVEGSTNLRTNAHAK